MMPWQSLNFYNLMFIVFILTLVLLLGSHILFIFFPSFIEIFENTIGYGEINLGIASSQLTTSRTTLSGVFGNRLKIKALPNFNIGLEFLITYFTLSKFSESFQSFIQDILSNGKNDVGEEVSSISQFSDFELKKEFGISDEFIKAINERKIENNKDPNKPPYDFMKDQNLKDLYNRKFVNDFENLEKFRNDLFELTLAKYRIGSFCWSYFISTIIFIASINAFIT